MDTAPLPPVGRGPGAPGPGGPDRGDTPTDWLTPVPPAGGPLARRPGRGLRVLEVLAGLASGGLLIVGLALLVLQFLAPQLAPGTGLSAPSGPGWPRIAWQLGVGVAGELVVLARRRSPRPARWLLAAAVVVATGAVLWLAWWR